MADKRPIYEICNPFKKAGKPRLYDSPEELWDDFVAYCKWVDDNPWQVNSARQSDGEKATINKNVILKRCPYTLYEFSAFASIRKDWCDFKKEYESFNEGYGGVLRTIEEVCRGQQVKGATVNEFNANIVARLNSIADTQKVDVTSNGEKVEGFVFPKLTKEDFEELEKINNNIGQ